MRRNSPPNPLEGARGATLPVRRGSAVGAKEERRSSLRFEAQPQIVEVPSTRQDGASSSESKLRSTSEWYANDNGTHNSASLDSAEADEAMRFRNSTDWWMDGDRRPSGAVADTERFEMSPTSKDQRHPSIQHYPRGLTIDHTNDPGSEQDQHWARMDSCTSMLTTTTSDDLPLTPSAVEKRSDGAQKPRSSVDGSAHLDMLPASQEIDDHLAEQPVMPVRSGFVTAQRRAEMTAQRSGEPAKIEPKRQAAPRVVAHRTSVEVDPQWRKQVVPNSAAQQVSGAGRRQSGGEDAGTRSAQISGLHRALSPSTNRSARPVAESPSKGTDSPPLGNQPYRPAGDNQPSGGCTGKPPPLQHQSNIGGSSSSVPISPLSELAHESILVDASPEAASARSLFSEVEDPLRPDLKAKRSELESSLSEVARQRGAGAECRGGSAPSPLAALSREDAEVAAHFAWWAQGRWESLRDVFNVFNDSVEDTAAFGDAISQSAFSAHIRRLGFEGDTERSFHVILNWGSASDSSRVRDGTSLNLEHLEHFERWAESIASPTAIGVDPASVHPFVGLLRKHRGTTLRAWRLDFDRHGTGWVSRAEFAATCRKLGFGSEGGLFWMLLRPDGGRASLQFWELDPEEALNLRIFEETLWSRTGFDFDRAWATLDPGNRRMLSFREFARGSRSLGFSGNAQLLFKGLDSTGLGRLVRRDFEYIRVVSPALQNLRYSAPSVHNLRTWMQVSVNEDGGIGALDDSISDLLKRLGFKGDGSDNSSMPVGELAARLSSLGFASDDALAVSVLAARSYSGVDAPAESLRALLSGQRNTSLTRSTGRGAPTSPGISGISVSGCSGSLSQPSSLFSDPSNASQRLKRYDWTFSTFDTNRANAERSPHTRIYFSVPERPSSPSRSKSQPPSRQQLSAASPRSPESPNSPASPGDVEYSRVPYREASPDGRGASPSRRPARRSEPIRVRPGEV